MSWASAVDLLQREGLQSPRIARTVDVWFEGIRSPAEGGEIPRMSTSEPLSATITKRYRFAASSIAVPPFAARRSP